MQNILIKLNSKRALLPLITIRNCFLSRQKTICKFSIPKQSFHFTSKHNVKMFLDKENLHAYEIIKGSKIFAENLKATDDASIELNDHFNSIDWKLLSPEELTEKFVVIAERAEQNNICISDKIFDKLIDEIIRKCRRLSDNDIFKLLRALKRWPETESINSNNFGDLWSALDDMCIERYRNWETEILLNSAELWYNLNLGKVSEYMGLCLDRIARKPNKLTSKQIVELMFYVNVLRRPLTNMIDFEYKIVRVMDELNVDELAVICMAFFKTQTTIKDSIILTEIIQKVRQNVDSIHEISLCAIMKVIRYSRHLNIVDQINCLLDDLVDQIDRLSLLSCLHIGLIGTISHLFHETILSKIANKFITNIENARLKDIERITFIATLFDYTPNCDEHFYENIIKNIRTRNEEIEKYPRCLVSSVHYLSLRQLYPVDLIKRILNPDFLKHTYGKNIIGREIFNLDTCLKIDLPNYDGERLTDEKRLFLSKRYTKWPPTRDRSMSLTDKIFLEVIDSTTDLLGGHQYIEVNHILPHFERADIVFGLNPNNKSPIKISNIFSTYTLSDVKIPPKMKSDIEWYVLVIGGWNHFIRDTKILIGPIKMKIRQLEKIGYHPILINWSDWRSLNSHELKIKHIENLIQQQRNCNFQMEIKKE